MVGKRVHAFAAFAGILSSSCRAMLGRLASARRCAGRRLTGDASLSGLAGLCGGLDNGVGATLSLVFDVAAARLSG